MVLSASNRRQRYIRRPITVTVTPKKLRLLSVLAQFAPVTAVQAAALADCSEKSARRQLRELFDGGYVHIAAVPRTAFADPGDPNDQRLLYGSSPYIFSCKRTGLRLVSSDGSPMELRSTPSPPAYGPHNAAFLAHELLVRDVAIWLTRSAGAGVGQRLITWRHGAAAVIDLKRTAPPIRVIPDALFVYGIAERALCGLVEVDQGTERGGKRWLQKIHEYGHLFQSGRLKDVTGYAHARILTVTPTAARRDHLAEFVRKNADTSFAQRCWFAQYTALHKPGFASHVWRQPGHEDLLPLLPEGGS